MCASRLRRFIPRFSLRTLVMFLLLVTSATALYCRWQFWRRSIVLGGPVVISHFEPGWVADECTIQVCGPRAVAGGGWRRDMARCMARLDAIDGVRTRMAGNTLLIEVPKRHYYRDNVLDIPACDPPEGEDLFYFPEHRTQAISVGTDRLSATLWERRRTGRVPFCAEFWLTVAFAAALVWGVLRDRRSLSAPSSPSPSRTPPSGAGA